MIDIFKHNVKYILKLINFLFTQVGILGERINDFRLTFMKSSLKLKVTLLVILVS